MKQHRLEELLDLMEQAFNQELERLLDYSKIDGRYVFHVPLTEEEQLARFQNPQMRDTIIKQILDEEGEKGVDQYMKHIGRMTQKKVENAISH